MAIGKLGLERCSLGEKMIN